MQLSITFSKEQIMEPRVNQVAKQKIRFWLDQIDKLKRQYQDGQISKETWLTLTKEYRIRIKAVQSVFQSL